MGDELEICIEESESGRPITIIGAGSDKLPEDTGFRGSIGAWLSHQGYEVTEGAHELFRSLISVAWASAVEAVVVDSIVSCDNDISTFTIRSHASQPTASILEILRGLSLTST